jgi:hypothetical protein
MKIVLTSALTVFGGVLVFVIGQIVVKFFLEPIHEQSRVISEINDSLIYFSNLYMNPDNSRYLSSSLGKERDEASKTLRRHAGQLDSKTNVIACYGLWERLRVVPKHPDVTKACKGLIGLSNALFSGTSDSAREFRNQITKGLNLPFV